MYPNTFYRVSVKALVTNEQGGVLVLKENQDTWSLPGGGLDHGEDPVDGIRREIEEEIGVTDIEITGLRQTYTFELKAKNAWLMWVVYNVKLHTDQFKLGDGVTEATYLDPGTLKDSSDLFEKLVHRAATSS